MRTQDLTFTTSELGGALTDTSVLLNKTCSLDLATANIVEPPGVGAVLGGLVENGILVGVVGADGPTLRVSGGIESDIGGQGHCIATFSFPNADFSAAPEFSIGPRDTVRSFAGLEIRIGHLRATGTFAPDGRYFDTGTLSGVVDVRLRDRGHRRHHLRNGVGESRVFPRVLLGNSPRVRERHRPFFTFAA